VPTTVQAAEQCEKSLAFLNAYMYDLWHAFADLIALTSVSTRVLNFNC